MHSSTSRGSNSTFSGKLSWFECLLNPHLLDQHFKLNPRSQAGEVECDLIINFLSNAKIGLMKNENPQASQNPNTDSSNGWASTLSSSEADLNVLLGVTTVSDEIPITPSEKKKYRALKILALKVASFLKWDLEILCTKLPLHMQSALLHELKKSVLNATGENESETSDSWKAMKPDTRFAESLLYRWTLRTVISGSYPIRQTKGLNVQIPGQTDPSYVPPETMEFLMKTVKEQCAQSKNALETLISLLSLEDALPVRMATYECFESLNEEMEEASHKWDFGALLSTKDLLCQLTYDLGCIYFFHTQYTLAEKMFKRSLELLLDLEFISVVTTFDRSKLEGYIMACEQILKKGNDTMTSTCIRQLLDDAAVPNANVISILLDDNTKRRIHKGIRNRMELDFAQMFGTAHPFYAKIIVANSMRCALDSDLCMTDLRQFLVLPQIQDFFCTSFKALIEKTTMTQKLLLQKYLQLILSDFKDIFPRCQKLGILDVLFNSRNPKCLKISKEKRIMRMPRDFSFTQDLVAVTARKQRELLSTRRGDSVSALVKQLHHMTSGKPSHLYSLKSVWELPRSTENLVKSSLPSKDQDEIYVLLSKAIELRASKCYEDARQLFRKIQQETKDGSPKLNAVVQLELCHTDMLQFTNDPLAYTLAEDHSKKTSVMTQAQSCISLYQDSRETNVKAELINLAAHILLNCEDWSPLVSMEPQKSNPTFEFSRLLAIFCYGLQNQKTNRSMTRDLWEQLLSFLTTPNQYKRSSSGSMKENHPRNMFLQFVRGLKGSFALGVILSGMTRIYNLLKDDSTMELSAEHQTNWPTNLSSHVQLNASSVSLTLQELIHHGLSFHPTNPHWLSTLGDLMYVQGHYSAALKYYISMSASTSNFFSQPLPKYLFSDVHVKRMIQCFCKLFCHTQAAVMTQFLEELNYTLAFKVLSERTCNDSCNSHYGHIWDVAFLEFLVNLHAKRGETEHRLLAQHYLGLLELNANNNEEIQREAANIRKGQFLRALAKQYL